MESRKTKKILTSYPPSPLPNPPSTSVFKDLSNFKTPNQAPRTLSFQSSPYTQQPKFFTASKNTPVSHSRRGLKTSALKSKTAQRLKSFELEQSKSARKVQIEKEKSLQSLARSLTVWLNFLFENPGSCGCNVAEFTGEVDGSGGGAGEIKEISVNNGKRDSLLGRGVGVDGPWRGPKRQKDSSWRGMGSADGVGAGVSNSMYSGLRTSLREICSFEDLKERMRVYLSLGSCKEIFETMTQVTKNIDEGRLKMRASCPIVSDVKMKEKALRILMCYNPIWLRIGLYIILGGDSLLPNANVNSDQEIVFLRMVIEKQFFSHSGLAKAYAYNKSVEGLYRPGYYENLGNVILKRLLLLVIILDRVKSQTSLPLKYGIDGLDGGSPLLFSLKSNVKSSRQVLNDILSSDVMHGEGNLLAHLVIVGYKVSYQQSHLIEYDFKITDLFEDLQDGIRLCRSIQLLKHDSSILMKVVVPSDTLKKSMVNCGIALQYLKEAGVSLLDEDGTEIIGEDVVNGDKELTLSLLWNMFVHLQLPLLINKCLLSEEISKIRGVVVEQSSTQSILDLLLGWVQAICESYDLKIENYSSLLDGKAMWCLLDYYFRKELVCSCSFKDLDATTNKVSIMSAVEYTDAVHNFILTQKLTSLLGNFPEVLQVSDILEHNGACNGRSVVVLLVFLSFQLLVRKNTDTLNFHKLLGFNCQSPYRRRLSTVTWSNEEDNNRNFKAIMTWWQDMARQNNKCNLNQETLSSHCHSTSRMDSNVQKENAATIIQSHFKRSVQRRHYLRERDAVLVLQNVIRSWLSAKKKLLVKKANARNTQSSIFSMEHTENFGTYNTFMVDRYYFVNWKKYIIVIQRATRAWISQRHCSRDRHYFVTLKRSIIIIQRATRAWISWRRCSRGAICKDLSTPGHVNAVTVIQRCIRGWNARSVIDRRVNEKRNASGMSKENGETDLCIIAAFTIQNAWQNFTSRKFIQSQNCAATKIQSYYRGWLMRKHFANKKQAIVTIQNIFKHLKLKRDFNLHRKQYKSAIIIQSHARGWMARKFFYMQKSLIVVMQNCCRGWLQRREFLCQKNAARKIQSAFRYFNCRTAFLSLKSAAIDIQQFVRGETTRKRLLGASCYRKIVRDSFQGFELKIFLRSVLKLQRWWRNVLLLRVKVKSVIVIQSQFRGWIARQIAARERQRIVVIQSYWKGYIARKDSMAQLLDLRLRMQQSAANVDDSMRLINRLVAALSELLSMRSVSGILHTCATLDMATEHSQKCCEELVAVGAVGTLLKLIRSVSRSIPDQQVLKHALSTLRNLARYPHLTEIVIENRGSVETILWEFLRNKEEAYFIASELLKKICQKQKGVEAVHNSPALLRRLHNLVVELARKAGNDKSYTRNLVAKEQAERRLREAVELLELITNSET
ncbi:abnormal spindle-like microcephaly-associated homolog isoform X2 [Olea europaea subsp. europaea]|uniref:Abnormal spindle-like microcephaly-associated homolog isoform X2 n=1 Tax=Olea europaea subsp. europaea TaxID=158383 RepID=A0A8S0SKI2_OLEEU|nr:abnormal spindle-like microcephaly-associated homolog isoform X2 [Olea europaea subsp. europaea]